MDCGIPFCHTGQLVSGMASGCPIHNLIPEWNDLVYRGLWKEALDRLHKTNNFPEFTGRVCPAPCEGSCVLGINNPPVTIKNIECEIIDHGWENGWVVPEAPEKAHGQKSRRHRFRPGGTFRRRAVEQGRPLSHRIRARGPSGRIADVWHPQHEARQKGSRAAPPESCWKPKASNLSATPRSGKIYPAEKLLKEFDAVVLATGATKPRDLPIPGREFEGHSLRDGFSHGEYQGHFGQAQERQFH